MARKQSQQRRTAASRRRLKIACAALVVVALAWPAAASAATLPGLPSWTGSTPWWQAVEQSLATVGWKLPTSGPAVPPPTQAPGSGGVTRQGAGASFSGSYTGSAGTRSYTGYVPSTYAKSKALPLVVVLHGCTQSPDVIRQLTRFDQLAETRGFIAVFPQQPSSANYLSCWNWFQDANMHRGSGEPSLIAGITNRVQHRYSVDPHRIYVAGLSAGGAMAAVMGATYPDVFAAIGVGSGCEYAATAACAGYQSAPPAQAAKAAYAAMGSHARAMPVIAFQGDKDTTVPPVNAEQLMSQWQQTNDLADDGQANGSIPATAAATTQGQVPGGRSYAVRSYNDAKGGELMQYWLVQGMSHAWSGGCGCESYSDPQGPDETAAMYDFFTKHPMP